MIRLRMCCCRTLSAPLYFLGHLLLDWCDTLTDRHNRLAARQSWRVKREDH